MKKTKDRFAIWIPVKPYVKAFLLHNFNAPDEQWPELINLSSDKDLLNDFTSRVAKESRFDKKYQNMVHYTERVPIEVSKDTFYRYGWEVSNAQAVGFGRKIEGRVKQMLFTYLDTSVGLGFPISVSIRNFQKVYRFTEDVWPYDSIRREHLRHRSDINLYQGNIIELINKIVLEKLSTYGTITEQAKNLYENNK